MEFCLSPFVLRPSSEFSMLDCRFDGGGNRAGGDELAHCLHIWVQYRVCLDKRHALADQGVGGLRATTKRRLFAECLAAEINALRGSQQLNRQNLLDILQNRAGF